MEAGYQEVHFNFSKRYCCLYRTERHLLANVLSFLSKVEFYIKIVVLNSLFINFPLLDVMTACLILSSREPFLFYNYSVLEQTVSVCLDSTI